MRPAQRGQMLLAFALVCCLWGCSRLEGLLQNPVHQAERWLKTAPPPSTHEFLAKNLAGSVVWTAVQYRSSSVSWESKQKVMLVSTWLEAEAMVLWGGEAARLSYIGHEHFHLRLCESGFCREPDHLQKINALSEALALVAVQKSVFAWQVRREEDGSVVVGEDSGLPNAPHRSLMHLVEDAEGRWRIIP